MTSDAAEDYARAVGEYEHRKSHLYLWGHDDRTLRSCIKGWLPHIKFLIIMVLSLVVASALFAAFCILMGGGFLEMFVGSLVVCAVCLVGCSVYGYFMYINYVDGNAVTAEMILTGGYCWLFYSYFDEYPFVCILVAFVVFFVSIWVLKRMFWDSCNTRPKMEDFEEKPAEVSEQG